jgi:hypothetical protein
MKLKLLAFAFALFLVISVALNILLLSKNSVYFSFEKTEVAQATPTPDNPQPTDAPSSTSTESSTQTIVKNWDPAHGFLFDIGSSEDAGPEKLEYILTGYELAKEIIVKGQRAMAVAGRQFLIVNIHLTNQLDRTIDVRSRDYLRLSVNNGEWMAPDIHNDPVEIEPKSSIDTQLGFPINESDKNLRLKVGEINSEGTIIPIGL